MATDVFLIRHGESYSNVEGRLCGNPPGPGLTLRGRRQAEAACQRLLENGVQPRRVLSSPLRRTLETAQPLAFALGLPVEIEPALRETRFGRWEGRLTRTLAHSAAFHAWMQNPEEFPPPGGERLSDIGRRTQALVHALARTHPGETLVAYSHMHPILALVLGGKSPHMPDPAALSIPNAVIVHIRCSERSHEVRAIDLHAFEAGGAKERPAAGGS